MCPATTDTLGCCRYCLQTIHKHYVMIFNNILFKHQYSYQSPHLYLTTFAISRHTFVLCFQEHRGPLHKVNHNYDILFTKQVYILQSWSPLLSWYQCNLSHDIRTEGKLADQGCKVTLHDAVCLQVHMLVLKFNMFWWGVATIFQSHLNWHKEAHWLVTLLESTDDKLKKNPAR